MTIGIRINSCYRAPGALLSIRAPGALISNRPTGVLISNRPTGVLISNRPTGVLISNRPTGALDTAYSKALNGAFCKYCVVFAGNTGGVGNQPLGNLVISPFQQYKNAHRTLGVHQAREYHIASVTDSEHFIRIKENNQPTIVEKIDSNRRAKIIENRKRLIPIIECVLLCGREEIPLRGHSDYGRIIVDDDHDGSREGNFRAILKYRAKGDQFLKNILEGPVNSAKCFSILADETTDISTKEQLSLTVRYIDDDAILHEDFLQFYVIESLTGSDLASSILNALIKALDTICSEWSDTTDASILKKCILDSEFLIALSVTKLLFSFGLPLCKLLQKERIDLKCTVNMIEVLIITLKKIREDAKNEFHILYENVEKIASEFDLELTKKRVVGKQTNRENPPNTNSVEDYYRVTVFVPYLDNFISQLSTRFLNHKSIFNGFDCLFKTSLNKEEREEFKTLVEFYSPHVETFDICISELQIWKNKIQDAVFKNALEAIKICDKDVFPNVHFLIKIFCTLPVSTAEPERSFSSMKRIKTYLRNSMKETRLNGLSLMSIHRDIEIKVDEVIDELALDPRKIDLLL
ncbi:unnamed protein product [Macrosiphum euphorbiae]|uniref:HAT C-terminal dimerisation domain-containing protein n=1 Tax=Macrosiphum euphorbiae TaxID=13131 RepID=A0AAV0XY55_9HEMI|nr:unnamed protein product [Macrosiphum euphorbiae]